jgi:hypothetical protein
MRRTQLLRIGVGVVLAGAAVAGFLVFIVAQVPSESRLARLVVPGGAAHLPGRPVGAAQPASQSKLEPVRVAAGATPGETGAYAAHWNGAKARAATLDLFVLPTVPEAVEARRSADAVDLAQSSLTTVGFGYAGTIRVSGVQGAQGASYLTGTSPTVTPKVPHLDVAVFRVGRVVVVARAAGATAGKAYAALLGLAKAERRHVLLTGATPSLAEASVPALAAAVYLVVAALLVAAAVTSPTIAGTLRRRRLAAHEEAIRRERAARGRKVVQRRGGPALPGRSRARR